jgi:acyl-CoA hydrolase
MSESIMEMQTYQNDQRPRKTTGESRTHWFRSLLYEDINGSQRLFGGRLMDEVAGVTAQRHCGGFVTTASVDNLQFKRGAHLNDLVVIIGKITHVGRTSMEVRVDSYIEDRETGLRYAINRCYVTEVYVVNDKPAVVPYGLELQTEVEKAEWEGALKRIENRKHRKREGF